MSQQSYDRIKLDIQEVGFDLWIGLIWFRIGTSGRLSNEHDNEPMKFYEEHKCEEFHNSLSDY